jgi:hypothetical protein
MLGKIISMKGLTLPPCGALCEICRDFKRGICKGCVKTKGKPWFLKRFTRFEICPIYKCAVEKGVEKCIDCKEFPCKTFLEWYNPRIGFFRSSLARIGSLLLRKKVGTKKWRKILIKYEGSSKVVR